jgi:plastocyanin
MKRILHVLIFSFVVGFSFAQNLQTNAINVGQGGNNYSPNSITVNPGDSVSFVWAGGTHTTMPDNGAWASGSTTSGTTNFTQSSTNITNIKVTNTPGSYTYHCTIHGTGMSGTIIVSGPAAINDPKENKFEFSAAPNPFDDQLSLNINIGDKTVTEVKIYDLIGKEVASVNLSGKTGFHSYRVDTSNLKAGIYFCTVYTTNGILETRKLFRRN